MRERSFRYGENSRGLGMMTLPELTATAPVVVMLNAGLLHREEPYRLNVLASRRLAEIGYICVRADLSGKGDSPPRPGLINRESVALDWEYIKKALLQQFGPRNLIIMGLCSGADNGIKIAAQDTAVRGLVLMDAVSMQDLFFTLRAWRDKAMNPDNWINLPQKLARRIRRLFPETENPFSNPTVLRDEPTAQDMRLCFSNLVTHNGRILAFFTSHALERYNQQGQFARALGMPGLGDICEEHFWPHVQHLYPVQTHRDQLLETIRAWGSKHLEHFQKQNPS